METVDLLQYGFFALAVTLAFAVRGATGFGSGAIAVPLAALVIPVQIVIPAVANLQLFSNTAFSLRNWRRVVWPEILRIAPFLVLGVFAGLYVFYSVDTGTIVKGLGAFIVAYAVYAMATAGRGEEKATRKPSWPLAVSLNIGGAFLGTVFGGTASPFYVMYLRALHLTRDAFRATMTMIILMQVVLRIGGYAGMGFLDANALLISALALPFMALGAKLGDVIVDWISPRTFNRVVGAVLLVSGTALLLK